MINRMFQLRLFNSKCELLLLFVPCAHLLPTTKDYLANALRIRPENYVINLLLWSDLSCIWIMMCNIETRLSLFIAYLSPIIAFPMRITVMYIVLGKH